MRHSNRQEYAAWQDHAGEQNARADRDAGWHDHAEWDRDHADPDADWHDRADWHWTPHIHEEEVDASDYDPHASDVPPQGSSRGTLVGIGTGIAAGLLVAAGAVWYTQGSFAFGVSAPPPRVAERPVRELSMAAAGTTVTEISLVVASGSLAVDAGTIYLTTVAIDGRPFSAAPEPSDNAARLTGRVVPMPLANPLNRNQMAATDGIRALQQLDQGAVPLPQRKPSMPDQRLAYASLPDASAPLSDAPSAIPGSQAPGTETPLSEDEPALPTAGSGYAIYDIKAKVVYMPNGDRLEAHSGYGDTFDDVRAVNKRMVGPTPPNTYQLTMRESLFHGIEAVRLNPVGTGKMFGRAGILAHPYLLGPRGDSNGCVSVKDYDKFLAAFKRGEVKKMVVVAELKNGPKREENFLLSWLKPKE